MPVLVGFWVLDADDQWWAGQSSWRVGQWSCSKYWRLHATQSNLWGHWYSWKCMRTQAAYHWQYATTLVSISRLPHKSVSIISSSHFEYSQRILFWKWIFPLKQEFRVQELGQILWLAGVRVISQWLQYYLQHSCTSRSVYSESQKPCQCISNLHVRSGNELDCSQELQAEHPCGSATWSGENFIVCPQVR